MPMSVDLYDMQQASSFHHEGEGVSPVLYLLASGGTGLCGS